MIAWKCLEIVGSVRWGRSIALTATVFALLALLAGCGGGGGGGGGGATVSVTGRVLSVVDDSVITGATVTISGQRATTAADGTFTLSSVSQSATTATVSAPNLNTRTLTIKLATPGASGTDALGDIYLSNTGYTAEVSGTVVTEVGSQTKPVGGATVTISGASATTATDGTFQISNLPVGLGIDPNTPIGTISASGFNDKPILVLLQLAASPPINNLGQLVLGTPISGTTPGLPYTITGEVLSGGKTQSGVSVTIVDSNKTVLGSTTTDTGGNFYFWVVPGTYTLIAAQNGNEFTVSATLTSTSTPLTGQNITIN